MRTGDQTFRYVRQGVLFVIGCTALIIEIINASFRDSTVHGAIIVLGLTLCGVGASDFAEGRLRHRAK